MFKRNKSVKNFNKISSKQSFIAYDCWAWPLPPRPKQSFGGRRGSRTRIATINQLYWQRLNNHSYKRCWDLEWNLIALCRNLIKVHQHCWNILHYSNSHVLIRKFVYQKAFIQSDKLSHYQFDESSIKFYPFAKYFDLHVFILPWKKQLVSLKDVWTSLCTPYTSCRGCRLPCPKLKIGQRLPPTFCLWETYSLNSMNRYNVLFILVNFETYNLH